MAAVTLQIVHVGDFELETANLDRVPRLAAIVDGLVRQQPDSLILSVGGNFFPGPLLTAGGDPAVEAALAAAQDARFGLPDGSFGSLAAAPGRIDVAILNSIGIQASALGNQEFDLGTGVLADAIGADGAALGVGGARWLGVEFPYLAANLDASGDPRVGPLATDAVRDARDYAPSAGDLDGAADGAKIAPATIIEVAGERVGVVGFTSPNLEIISSPGGTDVADTPDLASLAALLQPVIDGLRDQGIDKIVLLANLGDFGAGATLAPLLAGVDVVIVDGSQTAPAEYPVHLAGADGDPVLLVATAANYAGVGRLELSFDDAGRIVAEGAAGVVPTTDVAVAELWGAADPYGPGTRGGVVADLVDAARAVIVDKDGDIAGRSDVFLDGRAERIAQEETNLGDLVADADLAAARAVDPLVQVALKNAGAIRESIGLVSHDPDGTIRFVPSAANAAVGKEAGDISRLDIENVLRFDNALTAVTVTRAQLVALLEHGVADGVPGQFPQVSGIAFSFDAMRPSGDRILSAALVDADGHVTDVLARDGAVVGDADAAVRIVTIAFLAENGDGYPLAGFIAADPDFADRADLAGADGVVTEQAALTDHLARQYADTPFAAAETPAEEDDRIQNLAASEDGVLDGPYDLSGTAIGDQLAGSDAADTLSGGEGDDGLAGGGAGDLLLGGAGFDILLGEDGADFILAGAFGDLVDGGAGDDLLLAGNRGTDRILGGDGRDRLAGGQDADTLDGGAGADTLSGDRGDDLLQGGRGADRFVFAPGSGDDVILDFDPAEDRIVLAAGMTYVLQVAGDGDAVLALGDGGQVELHGWTVSQIAPSIADLVLFGS